MSEIIIVVSAFLTNAIMTTLKPQNKEDLTPTQLEKRTLILRVFSAIVTMISTIGVSLIMGQPLVEVESEINGSIQVIVTMIATWLTSQGSYFFAKSFTKS